MPKHRHKFKIYSFNMLSLSERCACGATQDRKPNPKEKKRFLANWKQSQKDSKELHKLYHEFCRKFRHLGGTKKKKTVKARKGTSKKKSSSAKSVQHSPWKWTAYELMERVEKWAKKNPTVTYARCDDNHFASSDLVFIPHQNKKEYMGSTVVFLAQCDGQSPATFFLYPSHVDSVMSALNKLKELEAKKSKIKSRKSFF
jgi:hypothetical protein